MTRQWAAQGGATWRPERLIQDVQVVLEHTLKGHGIELTPAFHAAVADLVGSYRAARAIAQGSRPAAVRRDLDRLIKTTDKLARLVDQVDANAVALLRESGIPQDRFRTAIDAWLRALETARQAAKEYPQKGRLPEMDRLGLAVDLAKSFQNHLQVEPTATHEGPFEEALAIVLEAAIGDQANDVHDLARRACHQLSAT